MGLHPLRTHVEDGRTGVGWGRAAQHRGGGRLRDLRGYDLPVSTDTHRLMQSLSKRPQGPWYPVGALLPALLLEWWDVRVILASPDDAEKTARWAEVSGWTPVDSPSTAPLLAWRTPSPGSCGSLASTTVSSSPEQAPWWLQRAGRTRHTVLVEADGPCLSVARTEPAPVTSEKRRRIPNEPLLGAPGTRIAPGGLGVLLQAGGPVWQTTRRRQTVRVGGATGVGIPAEHKAATLYYRPDGWIRGQRLLGGGRVVLLIGLAVAQGRAINEVPSRSPAV